MTYFGWHVLKTETSENNLCGRCNNPRYARPEKRSGWGNKQCAGFYYSHMTKNHSLSGLTGLWVQCFLSNKTCYWYEDTFSRLVCKSAAQHQDLSWLQALWVFTFLSSEDRLLALPFALNLKMTSIRWVRSSQSWEITVFELKRTSSKHFLTAVNLQDLLENLHWDGGTINSWGKWKDSQLLRNNHLCLTFSWRHVSRLKIALINVTWVENRHQTQAQWKIHHLQSETMRGNNCVSIESVQLSVQ